MPTGNEMLAYSEVNPDIEKHLESELFETGKA